MIKYTDRGVFSHFSAHQQQHQNKVEVDIFMHCLYIVHTDINSVPMLAGMWERFLLTKVGCTGQKLLA